MAKTHSPLWSLQAWQSVGESVVYAWCGSEGSGVFRREGDHTQLERYYEPFNPQTELQQEVRSEFASAVSFWQGLTDADRASWNYYQDVRRRRPVMSGYNLFISKYLLSGGNPIIPPSGRTGDEGKGGWSLPEEKGGEEMVIKSGQSIGAKKTEVQVDFATAFANVPRVIITDWNGVDAWLVEVTASYFKWKNNSPGADVTVDWIAIDAGNS